MFHRKISQFQNNTIPQTNYFKNLDNDQSNQQTTKTNFAKVSHKSVNNDNVRSSLEKPDNRNNTTSTYNKTVDTTYHKNKDRPTKVSDRSEKTYDKTEKTYEKTYEKTERPYPSRYENNISSEEKKGMFADIQQKVYEIDKKKKVLMEEQLSGEFLIKEEILVDKESQSEDIYRYDLSQDKFIESLASSINNIKNDSKKKVLEWQVIDNYYLYNYVVSIKNGITNIYTETTLSCEYNNGKYDRVLKRVYMSLPSDLDGYRDYHLIVRILRVQVGGSIFEIIIPRNTEELYKIENREMFMDNFIRGEIKNLPVGTQYMIRRNIS